MTHVFFKDIVKAVLARPMPDGALVPPNHFYSHLRWRAAVDARTIAAVLAHRHLRDVSLSKIGRLMGRDHTTVYHLVNRKFRREVKRLAPLVAEIEAELGVEELS